MGETTEDGTWHVERRWTPPNGTGVDLWMRPNLYMSRSSCTMVLNRKKYRMNSHQISHFLASEGASNRVSAAERASKVSCAEQANKWAVRVNRRARGPVLESVFLVDLDHSGLGKTTNMFVTFSHALRTVLQWFIKSRYCPFEKRYFCKWESLIFFS